ncbi:MAG TPA: 2-phosphosulfolactate phosphatase [Ignavibacteriaceae bacterium]|nr:2-phosphosulfolactate phosphatase [Ignavibacteriaceae bacterium]
MKLDVLFSPVQADELFFTGKTTVVIDVLRASSTIITALSNGAKEVVPVGTVEFAVKVSGGIFGGQTLLGGERNTKKIEGFALGNSPSEYTKEIVSGKSIVFYSTNGSRAIVKAKYSTNLFVCSFNNLKTVAKHIKMLDQDVIILCAGNNNLFSLEDSVCAGMLVSELIAGNKTIQLTDASTGALTLFKSFGKNIFKMLSETDHGQLLINNGFEVDLKACAELGSTDVIPFYSGNVLKVLM